MNVGSVNDLCPGSYSFFLFPFVFLSFSFLFPFPFLFLSLLLCFPFPSFTLPFPFPFPRSCEFFGEGVKPALERTIRKNNDNVRKHNLKGLGVFTRPRVLLTCGRMQNPLCLPRKTTSERPKVLRTWCVLYIFTWKCASRHSGMHFFDVSTSRSAPNLVCFVHVHLEMCFMPQWHALFRRLNVQKCSEPGVFCTFSLGNVLRATMACTFSTSQLPEVLRTWCVLIFFTCKCASRHNSMHFFDISPSKSAPNLVCVLYILTSTCSSRHNGVQF